MKYLYLFEAGNIGKVTLNNRIVMAPMGTPAMTGYKGTFSERVIDYYEIRALGGIGLIITGLNFVNSKIEPLEIDGQSSNVTFDHWWKVRNFIQLTERVHDYGAKIFAQLTAGFGRVSPKRFLDRGGIQCIAPSPVQLFWRPDRVAREMTKGEIETIIESFGKAAEIARESKFDGVELHGHEGYLIDQFMSEIWNRRNDEYGGDFERRMNFPLSIIRTIRESAGVDFPIIFRLGLDHKFSGGRTVGEGIEIIKTLENAGVSALHVDAGCYDSWYWPHPPLYQPPGCMVDMAETAKKHVSLPIIAVGRLGYPALADRILKEGRADFVAMGRPLLADPDLAAKARRGEIDDIRPCIGCHECLERLRNSQSISCAVNPQCGDERRLSINKTSSRKKVMVIGGGIAGMEAARVCALRGHSVNLYEKTDRLGGILKVASNHGFKQDLKRLMDYQVGQVQKMADLEISINTEVTEEIIQREKPDVIFLATGSEPITRANIQGLEQATFVTAEDVYEGRIPAGSRAVVIGGGSVGCEVALYLADQHWRVTVLEMLSGMAADLFSANREMLLKELTDRNVELVTNATVERVNSGEVVAAVEAGHKAFSYDLLVLSIGRSPVNELDDIAKRLVKDVYVIGDCRSPRKIKDAIWDAFKLSRIV
jgi:2-enoate reductase